MPRSFCTRNGINRLEEENGPYHSANWEVVAETSNKGKRFGGRCVPDFRMKPDGTLNGTLQRVTGRLRMGYR